MLCGLKRRHARHWRRTNHAQGAISTFNCFLGSHRSVVKNQEKKPYSWTAINSGDWVVMESDPYLCERG